MNATKSATTTRGKIAHKIAHKSAGKAALVAANAELPTAAASPAALLAEVRELILATRQTVAQGVNSALVLLYWHIGQRVRSDILKSKRAEYGAEILPTLSAKLVPDFGQGFSPRNLARMISLAEAFPDSRILATLSKELGWSHFVELLPFKSDERIELFELTQRGIRVSEYLTELPPKKVLEQKLLDAVRSAQAHLQAGEHS